MFRHFLLLLCSFVFAIQVVVIAGCGGSSSKAAASGGSGSGGGNGPSPNAASVCGGKGSGYNNQNGSVSGVWIQSPAPGQNESTVQVNANGYATVPITQWTVCLDGQPAYQTNSDATSISHSITMTAGQHLLWATVTDAKGDSNRSEVRLIQVGPAPPSSTVLPTPPGNAQVLNQMQNDSTWGICSLCAAGTNTSSNYWMKPSQSQPSLSGSSLEMYAGGQSWTNVLFMDTKLGTNNSTHFLWDFYVYHDPADEDHFWSSEFDFWQVLGGKEFMIGSQCDFGDGYWAMWDTEGDRWVLNDIPCTHWTPGWHHVQWYLERISPTQYRYDTLVFDGKAYGLNQSWNFGSTTWQDMIGVQFQLDQDTSGTPLHEWVDNVTLTIW
ncbi:MAG TPA: hypothetical protein VN753_06275 [Terracidiphilus sp.]|nr:hypothetical protein [Terracidiphilus sp.]